MASQGYSNPASRNPATASGVEPGKVSAPAGPVTLGKAPEPGINGPALGSATVKGFSGSGVIAGKVKA